MSSKSSTAGVTTLVIVAIIGVVNYLVGGLGVGNFRVDVTEDGLYTLSEGTKNILQRIDPDKPVTVRYYVSSDDRVMPPMLKTYSRNVQDLLLEFEKAADDQIILERLTPNPDTDDEDKAREDQIQGMQVNAEGDNIYLGLAIQSGSQREVIAFLNPSEETKLEYDLARAINKVTSSKKPVIGLISPMPVTGSPMFQFQPQRGQEPWTIISQLRLDYEVREVPFQTDTIDSDISVLVIIHPGDILESTEYAIDQYLLKGGRVVACVDPLCWIGQSYNGGQDPMTGQSRFVAQSSDLPNLFKAWGIGYQKDQVVADMYYRGVLMGRQNATALQLPRTAINETDRITEGLQSVSMVSGGAFTNLEAEGVTVTPLLESSEQSDLLDIATAESLRTQPLKEFSASGRKKILGLRLSGKFKSAFPNGPPVKPPPSGGVGETGGAESEAAAVPVAASAPEVAESKVEGDAPMVAENPAAEESATKESTTEAAKSETAAEEVGKTEEAAKPTLPADYVSESTSNDSAVVLFSDADMFYDAFSMSQDQMTGMLVAINSNIPMFLNAVELMSGGGDLLTVRSRASTQRPFVKLDEMREKVEIEYRPELQALETRLNETAEKIGTLRLTTDAKSKTLMLDPAQQKQLEELMATQADISKQVREVRKKQNREIDWTKNALKVLNILAMPLLVIVVGGLLALRRRSVTAAQ